MARSGYTLSRPRQLLVTILIGNELANVSATVLSAVIIVRLVGAELRSLPLAPTSRPNSNGDAGGLLSAHAITHQPGHSRLQHRTVQR